MCAKRPEFVEVRQLRAIDCGRCDSLCYQHRAVFDEGRKLGTGSCLSRSSSFSDYARCDRPNSRLRITGQCDENAQAQLVTGAACKQGGGAAVVEVASGQCGEVSDRRLSRAALQRGLESSS